MALHLLGYSLDHPALREGTRRARELRDPRERHAALRGVSVAGVGHALAMVALRDAGVAQDDPAMLRGGAWLLDEEIRVPGDWSVKRPKLQPGGWAFEFANDNYPDIDDTAEVILALRASGADPAPQRGRGAARDRVDLRHAVPRRRLRGLRRRQHQRAVRPAAVLRLRRGDRSAERRRHRARDRDARRRRACASDPRTLRARDWLLRAQEPDGSWFGRWGINYVYGTGAAVPALVRAGIAKDHASIRRAVRWLADAPERGRRLGRGSALVRGRGVARSRRVDAVADGVGAARAARGG